LANHPNDRARPVAEPELIPTEVEEFLRAYAPVTLAREIVKETRIGNALSRKEMVLMAFPAANRDPEKFANAPRRARSKAESTRGVWRRDSSLSW
jgi:cytochrome P450